MDENSARWGRLASGTPARRIADLVPILGMFAVLAGLGLGAMGCALDQPGEQDGVQDPDADADKAYVRSEWRRVGWGASEDYCQPGETAPPRVARMWQKEPMGDHPTIQFVFVEIMGCRDGAVDVRGVVSGDYQVDAADPAILHIRGYAEQELTTADGAAVATSDAMFELSIREYDVERRTQGDGAIELAKRDVTLTSRTPAMTALAWMAPATLEGTRLISW